MPQLEPPKVMMLENTFHEDMSMDLDRTKLINVEWADKYLSSIRWPRIGRYSLQHLILNDLRFWTLEYTVNTAPLGQYCPFCTPTTKAEMKSWMKYYSKMGVQTKEIQSMQVQPAEVQTLMEVQPMGEQTMEVHPTGEQPTEAQPTGEQPTEAHPTGEQPMEVQPTGEQPMEVHPTGEQLTEAQPTGEQPMEVHPTGEQPSEAQPTGEQPMEVHPTGEQPTEAQPTGEQPMEVHPTGEQPMEVHPTGEQPTEAQPTGEQPMEVQAIEKLGSHTLALEAFEKKSLVVEDRFKLSVKRGITFPRNNKHKLDPTKKYAQVVYRSTSTLSLRDY